MVYQIGSKRQNSETNSVYQKFSLPNFTLPTVQVQVKVPAVQEQEPAVQEQELAV